MIDSFSLIAPKAEEAAEPVAIPAPIVDNPVTKAAAKNPMPLVNESIFCVSGAAKIPWLKIIIELKINIPKNEIIFINKLFIIPSFLNNIIFLIFFIT